MIRPQLAISILCALFVALPASLVFGQAGQAKTPSEKAALDISGNETSTSPDATAAAITDAEPGLAESASSDEVPSADGNSGQTGAAAQGNAQSQTPPANNSQAPSLEDLGLTPSQAQGDPQLQARLDKRTHMLRVHQKLGLITAIPMIATVATSFGAGGRSTSTSDRWAHLALGSVTGDLYFTTAYFAIFAPRIPGTQTRGPIRVHKALAWIHGPGMILTPILGAIAFDQKSKGEKVHGIASAHGVVAAVTAGAFGAALVSVSFKF